jgi:hypothetical protein
MTDVVVLRPSTDAVEKTLAAWVDAVFPAGTILPGVAVLTLGNGTSAAAAQAACQGSDVVLYYGHGDETSLGDPVLVDDTTITCAQGATVIAIACLSGETLGPDSVATGSVSAYLGFTEPLFVYIADDHVIGDEIADCIKAYLQGSIALPTLRDDMESELKVIERRYHTGYYATSADAMLIWMGARMNWRGLVTC